MRSSAASLGKLVAVEAGYSCGALSLVIGPVGDEVGLCWERGIEEVMLDGGDVSVEKVVGITEEAIAIDVEDAGGFEVAEGVVEEVSWAKEEAGKMKERKKRGLERRCSRLLHLHRR